ncbi:MAG: hypothetical protein LZF60_420006 [Nitrospira sp.]|nr:MAG: hypothetical protein LZF60_420006 [Nitrospira sp.]
MNAHAANHREVTVVQLQVRWEDYASNVLGFVPLASFTMRLKQF